MVDHRKFSRQRHTIKVGRREEIERELRETVAAALQAHDPTALPSAVRVISELLATVGSQLLVQPQSGQRALISFKDDISDFGTEVATQLMALASKDVASRIRKTTVAAPVQSPLQLPEEWADPVAGPTLIERHFGIPRSTLYRWQRRDEVVALSTRTSKKPVFPLRQFVDGRPVDGLQDVIRIFGSHRDAWRWLVTATDHLGGEPPLDLLLSGRVDEVTEVAGRQALRSAERDEGDNWPAEDV